MRVKKHIPNLFTLGNLFCGTLATIFAVKGDFDLAALFVVLGIVFDFFDGFLARIFKVSGELGKQLDSLADMVTSGVAPGVVMFMWLNQSLSKITIEPFVFFSKETHLLSYLGLLLTLAACYRLANFNIDTRQTDSFIGVPTPAMSLFIVSLPLIAENSDFEMIRELMLNNYFLIGTTLVLSYLMNVELPLLSLKFKNYGFKENLFKYLLIICSVILIVLFKYLAMPLIIVVFIVLSIINNLLTKKHAV